MLLLKTSKATIGEVVRRAKHASNTRPNAEAGDIVLIAQTKSTLKPDEESIRYIMTYEDSRIDESNESQRIWGRHWKYLINGSNVMEIPGFNIEDVQVSKRNYDPIVTHCRLDPLDEEAVGELLSRSRFYEAARRVRGLPAKDDNQILAELQRLKSADTQAKATRSRRYFRDPRKSALLKELYEFKCQICNIRIEDTEGNPYAETHHIVGRAKQGPDESSNMMVLCPNHHKMFTLGSAKIDVSAKIVFVNGDRVAWTNKHL